MLLQHDRARIGSAFDAAHIAHAFLKGALIDAVFFDGRGVREVADIDVLIHRADDVLAWRAMVGAGYHRFVPASSSATDDAAKERLHRREDGRPGFDVDLHLGLINEPPFHDFAVDALRRRVVYATSVGAIPGLCPEDMLVHMGGNVGGDWLGAHAKLAGDTALLLGRFSIDLATVASRARRAGCDVALWALLRVAAERHGARVPAWLLAELAPTSMLRRRAVERVLAGSVQARSQAERLVRIDWPLCGRPLWPIEKTARWASLRVQDRWLTRGERVGGYVRVPPPGPDPPRALS